MSVCPQVPKCDFPPAYVVAQMDDYSWGTLAALPSCATLCKRRVQGTLLSFAETGCGRPVTSDQQGLTIEICVENADGLIAAQSAGADRAELCASLVEGGLTPSWGMIGVAKRLATIPFHVIVRPRGGDFLYSEAEFAAMLADVEALAGLGVAGVVFGCLTPVGTIDETRMRTLVETAGPMSTTCHRAFDMTRDATEAIEALVRCGVDRVLTSGQRDSAVEGLTTLRAAVAAAAGRIRVMACGGLNASNIAHVLRESGADDVHFAALREEASGMTFRNPGVGMGGMSLDREYLNAVTDEAAVRATIRAARGTR